jgi:hypothetical protein
VVDGDATDLRTGDLSATTDFMRFEREEEEAEEAADEATAAAGECGLDEGRQFELHRCAIMHRCGSIEDGRDGGIGHILTSLHIHPRLLLVLLLLLLLLLPLVHHVLAHGHFAA